jgi:hypothetical protein
MDLRNNPVEDIEKLPCIKPGNIPPLCSKSSRPSIQQLLLKCQQFSVRDRGILGVASVITAMRAYRQRQILNQPRAIPVDQVETEVPSTVRAAIEQDSTVLMTRNNERETPMTPKERRRVLPEAA